MDYAVKKMPGLWDYVKTEEKAKDEIVKDETSLVANEEISELDNVPWEFRK